MRSAIDLPIRISSETFKGSRSAVRSKKDSTQMTLFHDSHPRQSARLMDSVYGDPPPPTAPSVARDGCTRAAGHRAGQYRPHLCAAPDHRQCAILKVNSVLMLNPHSRRSRPLWILGTAKNLWRSSSGIAWRFSICSSASTITRCRYFRTASVMLRKEVLK